MVILAQSLIKFRGEPIINIVFTVQRNEKVFTLISSRGPAYYGQPVITSQAGPDNSFMIP